MGLGIVLFAGKYLFLIIIYVFVIALFRALLAQAVGGGAGTGPVARAEAPPLAPAAAPAAVAPALAPVVPTAAPQPRAGLEPGPALAPPPAAPQAPPRAVLVVLRSNALPAGQRIALSPSTTLGRGPQNTAILPDHYASYEHALIYLRDGVYMLRDRNSTNGTFLNGRRIGADTPLREGDQVAIGTTLLRYTEGI